MLVNTIGPFLPWTEIYQKAKKSDPGFKLPENGNPQ